MIDTGLSTHATIKVDDESKRTAEDDVTTVFNPASPNGHLSPSLASSPFRYNCLMFTILQHKLQTH